MKILALDLARKTGWAYGTAGSKPHSGIRVLRSTSEDVEVGADALGSFIVCLFEKERPDLIVYEAPIPPHQNNDADKENKIRRSVKSIEQPPMLVGAVRSMAFCNNIRIEKVWPSTWRKHFLGRANFGNRQKTKEATVERCRLLGYIPKDRVIRNKTSDPLFDECDALGIWDFASSKYGRVAAQNFAFYQERAR